MIHLFQLSLDIVYQNAHYDLMIQYNGYGTDEFIADVGGYLGLFLGGSLLSIYDDAVALVTKLLSVTLEWFGRRGTHVN